MDDLGWIEAPKARFLVHYHYVSGQDLENGMESKEYQDMRSPEARSEGIGGLLGAVLDCLHGSGVTLRSNRAMRDGGMLALQLEVQSLPDPIKATAVLSKPGSSNGVPGAKYSAQLRLTGVHRQDLAKSERFFLLKQRGSLLQREPAAKKKNGAGAAPAIRRFAR